MQINNTQTNKVFVTRSGISEGSQPEEPSQGGYLPQWVSRTVEWITHSVQWVIQTVRQGLGEETPLAAARQPGRTRPLCWPDHSAPVGKKLGQRAIEPAYDRVDLGRCDLDLNYQSPAWHWPQEGIPCPKDHPELEEDKALCGLLKEPQGLDFIRIQLVKRREALAEGKGDAFTFAPLMTTLANMKKFVAHIGAGKHFDAADHPLTASDLKALKWLEERAGELLKKKAPYELTVHLAFAFLAVYEVMVARRVPALEAQWSYKLVDMEPAEITAYRWGGNNTTGPKCGEEFYSLDAMPVMRAALTWLLHEPHMLMYPSFQPLGIGDFCQFGHLPVHPIGMITGYTCNADGALESPLYFARHDIGHMIQLSDVSIGTPGLQAEHALAADAMKSSDHRLVLRQMLLDHTPASLEALKPGLRILQFHLLHEERPAEAAKLLEDNNFVFPRCLEAVLGSLRRFRAGFPPDDINIADVEASMAALWTARLLHRWQLAGFERLAGQQLEDQAATFVARDLPLLRKHLDFIAQHRGRLRQTFITRYGRQTEDTKEHYSSRTDFFFKAGVLLGQNLTLFNSFNPDTGLCHEDNTDLVYFAALTASAERCAMEQCTGARLPENIVFASEISPP